MSIDVKSEIRPLKKVLLQRPGSELEQLVPNSLQQLLFDDIPYLQGAQAEHDAFAQTLRKQGVEVVYLSELTAQTLAQSAALRAQFVADFIRRSGHVADSYREALTEDKDSELYPLVKAADKLSAYIKCIEERKAGNNEFLSAEQQTRAILEASPLPEVAYFLKNFIPAFERNLDELGAIDQ